MSERYRRGRIKNIYEILRKITDCYKQKKGLLQKSGSLAVAPS
jgi:hypothetical protein